MSPRCISSIGLGTSVTASAPLRSAAKVPPSCRGRTLSFSIALCNDWARLPVEFHGGGAECVPRSAISVGIALGSARASLRRSRPRNRAALGHRSPTAVNRFEPRAATSWSTTAVRRTRPVSLFATRASRLGSSQIIVRLREAFVRWPIEDCLIRCHGVRSASADYRLRLLRRRRALHTTTLDVALASTPANSSSC